MYLRDRLAHMLMQDFDLDETFGAVQAGGDLEGTIELHSRLNRAEVHEFSLLVSDILMGTSLMGC